MSHQSEREHDIQPVGRMQRSPLLTERHEPSYRRNRDDTDSNYSRTPVKPVYLRQPTSVEEEVVMTESNMQILRVSGIIQILLGCICFIVGVAHIILVATETSLAQYNSGNYRNFPTSVLAGSPIWCGSWFIMTGVFGIATIKCRPDKCLLYKNTFMVLSYLSGFVFGIILLAVSAHNGVQDHRFYLKRRAKENTWLLPWFLVILALLEIIVAMCSGSYCLCCYKSNRHKVYKHSSYQEEPREPREPRELRKPRGAVRHEATV